MRRNCSQRAWPTVLIITWRKCWCLGCKRIRLSDCGPLYVAEPASHLLFEAWAETSLLAHGEGIRCPLRSPQDIKEALGNKSLIQTGGSLKNLDMGKRALNLGSIGNLMTLLHELLASEPLLSSTTEECLANMPY